MSICSLVKVGIVEIIIGIVDYMSRPKDDSLRYQGCHGNAIY